MIFRLSEPDIEPDALDGARALPGGLVVTVVLPLTALLLGTSVLGDEIEDGTAIYLLTKPLPRWQILAGRSSLAAWILTALLVVASTAASGLVALQSRRGEGIVLGFSVAMIVGALAYSTVFVLLSVVDEPGADRRPGLRLHLGGRDHRRSFAARAT